MKLYAERRQLVASDLERRNVAGDCRPFKPVATVVTQAGSSGFGA